MGNALSVMLAVALLGGGDYNWMGIPKNMKDQERHARIDGAIGLPASALVLIYGVPDQDQTVLGAHLLSWTYTEARYGMQCKMNVAATVENKIERLWFVGTVGGCTIMMRELPSASR